MGLKILTLNLHCYEEKTPVENFIKIAEFIKENQVDVVAFQESAQLKSAPILVDDIREGNSTEIIAKILGDSYHYFWSLCHDSFGKYEEGETLLSRLPMGELESRYVSKGVEKSQWNSRVVSKAVIDFHGKSINFISCHLSQAIEESERFEFQFANLHKMIQESHLPTIFLGDFNIPDSSKEYQSVLKQGYYDLYAEYCLGLGKKPEYTIGEYIDGWQHSSSAKRIDYIFSNTLFKVVRGEVIFSDDRVSDHCGIFIEIEV